MIELTQAQALSLLEFVQSNWGAFEAFVEDQGFSSPLEYAREIECALFETAGMPCPPDSDKDNYAG